MNNVHARMNSFHLTLEFKFVGSHERIFRLPRFWRENFPHHHFNHNLS